MCVGERELVLSQKNDLVEFFFEELCRGKQAFNGDFSRFLFAQMNPSKQLLVHMALLIVSNDAKD